ncbi:glycosyltransferase [Chryseobacterium taiwanense]|uniref:Glycosyl transferase family 1 domain-containing protein n=1 Tax=Chryseobacterium taiwanense TaxID=363331 RepID=A0A0B4D9R4_9FLAO|nr:glycosyltransferase [Chryseobacterium taiwanense]KIC63426.1 hypothetical protein RM51_07045 [Chryseobacterium taiwanense]
MILIDALYINNGGGKVLLDYLVKKLEKKYDNVFYIFDSRCSNDFQYVPEHRKVYMKASLVKRYQFYKNNNNKFGIFLCFGNLPPLIKLNLPVFTYFHNRLLINIPKHTVLKNFIMLKLKSLFLKIIVKNTDYVIVQSDIIKQEFLKEIRFEENKILPYPFYEPLNYPNTNKIKNRFIYVSSGEEYKNHKRLLQAFKKAYDLTKSISLVVTIDSSYIKLYEEINILINKGYPIENLGFVSKEKLCLEYAKAEFTIYPSITESFGISIIEAIEGGCKVIGANLPYMHAVCKPSLLFDPLNIDSIENAILTAMNNTLPNTEQKIFNKIDDIISLLT